jgi:hypothetical protein
MKSIVGSIIILIISLALVFLSCVGGSMVGISMDRKRHCKWCDSKGLKGTNCPMCEVDTKEPYGCGNYTLTPYMSYPGMSLERKLQDPSFAFATYNFPNVTNSATDGALMTQAPGMNQRMNTGQGYTTNSELMSFSLPSDPKYTVEDIVYKQGNQAATNMLPPQELMQTYQMYPRPSISQIQAQNFSVDKASMNLGVLGPPQASSLAPENIHAVTYKDNQQILPLGVFKPEGQTPGGFHGTLFDSSNEAIYKNGVA